MPDASKVLIGKPKSTGGVYAGPLATAAPDDAATALAVGFVDLGYVSDEGVTQAKSSDQESIKAWGGDEVRVVSTSDSITYKLTLIETNNAVLAEVFGESNVSEAAGVTTVTLNSATLPQRSYVFELVDGANAIRIYVPVGQITATGDVSFVDGEAIPFEIEISAYPDAEGNKAYWFIETIA